MAEKETFDLTLVAEMPGDSDARWIAMRADAQRGVGQRIKLGKDTEFTLEGVDRRDVRAFSFTAEHSLIRVRGNGAEETMYRQYEVQDLDNKPVARFRLYLDNHRFVHIPVPVL